MLARPGFPGESCTGRARGETRAFASGPLGRVDVSWACFRPLAGQMEREGRGRVDAAERAASINIVCVRRKKRGMEREGEREGEGGRPWPAVVGECGVHSRKRGGRVAA